MTFALPEAAASYRELGLAVIPVGRDKRPLVEWAQYQRELPHPDQVAVWWDRWPEASIGVATGEVSGLVVLDADGPAGLASLKALATPATTWFSRTGRLEGGWQQFFQHPGARVPNRAGLRPGLDVRGDGGYVIVPPSLHASGRRYEWLTAPGDLPLAPLPQPVLALLTAPAQTRSITPAGDGITQGRRNDHLYRLARAIHAKGAAPEAVLAALLEENRTRCDPPVSEAEVHAIAENAVRQADRPDFAAEAAADNGAACPGEPELRREGFDLTLTWPAGVRMDLTAIRDSRDGVRGELTVSQGPRRLSWGTLALSSTSAREGLRKKLEATAPGPPWGEYLEESCWRLTQAARQGEPLVTLTGRVISPTRELLPRVLYEGEPTLIYGDGDTGKSLLALTLAVAVQSGTALPFGLKPARPVPVAFLDWETSQDTVEGRLALIASGLGIDPPPILYKRMTRPFVDEAPALAAEFARRGIGFVVIDSHMFAVASGDGAAFHEPITSFYNVLRSFGAAASLVLSHVTGADARSGAPARPFGGAFAFNGPRLIWEAKRDPNVDDATAIAFTCRKANNLARRPDPFGLRFVPGESTITIYPLDLTEASPTVVAGTGLSYRIRLALAPGDLTTPQVTEALGSTDAAVRTTLRRLEGKGIVVNRGMDGKAIIWGLARS